VQRVLASPLVRFSVFCSLCLALLGVALGVVLDRQANARALRSARTSAVLLARAAFAPQLDRADLRGAAAPAHLVGLRRAATAAKRGGGLVRIKIWNPQGRVVFSDDTSLIGRRYPVEDELRAALGGVVAADVSSLDSQEQEHERRFGHLLEVYAPLRLAGSPRPVGAFELYLPYAPIATAIASDLRTADALIAFGLLLLFAALFRVVAGASRALRRQAAEREREALHDPLTGLANRRLLNQRFSVALADAARTSRECAVLVVDLDGFKELNDTLGHEAGDALLVAVAARLELVVEAPNLLVRLAGDEFAVLLPWGGSLAARELAAQLFAALETPFPLAGLEIQVRASIGAALAPMHGTEASVLLSRADVAMYGAKRSHTSYEVYCEERDGHSREALALAGDLRRGLEEGEITAWFQPRIDLRSGEVVALEALARWQHPERGLVPPLVFVPLIEQAGMMGRFTLQMLALALAEAASSRERGDALGVSVNLGAANVLDAGLADDVAALLAAHGVPAHRLSLEITETIVMTDPPRAHAVLCSLRALGVGLALDDFGTGYSSLAHLRSLPVDEVKIDRSFVGGMGSDHGDAAIVRSTVELARALGLRVVAEGVEDAGTVDALRRLGCDEVQGFLTGRPMPVAELRRWLAALRRDQHEAA
jgi:diguanylate cyclase (GGDEF)-like protein